MPFHVLSFGESAKQTRPIGNADTPIPVISGARQGRQKHLDGVFTSDQAARVVGPEHDADRRAAERDPDAFVAQYPEGVLAIDEVQRVRNLVTALKANIDADRRPGRFLITGSADLLNLRGSQESLAGRAETIPLDGLSQGEIHGTSNRLSHSDYAGVVQ